MDRDILIKVPAVTLGFWLIKILATTLGETGGDSVSMTLNLGYLVGSAIFVFALIILVWLQIRARMFHPFLYWATIIASTTAGTTMADFATRSMGIGYPGGSALLLFLVCLSLFVWHKRLGSINVATVHEPRAELFYWVTITFSQTLGTALGDWTADLPHMGYMSAAVIFAGLLAIVTALYFWTKINRDFLFWTAFILTRPLGAAVGDFLDKPLEDGGLAFSRPVATFALGVAILALIICIPQRAAKNH